MKFSPAFLDEIRARLPVSEVVGARVKLRKQGREWAGLSPFNAEKTPSFFVNDQKGFYHDFSSSKHGDIFEFVMEIDGLAFPDAVERLAAQAGVPMPVADARSEQDERRRASLHEIMAMAAKYFEAVLQDRAGARGRGYLADRGLDSTIQREFGLGFATPERFDLRDALAAKGVSAPDMIAAGLLISGDEIAVPYDRFRDRVMFPIQDRAGRVIAFGGRAMEAGAKAKYLNSPETELFHKGNVLYNHHRARKATHDGRPLVVVEGYIDVIALSRAGYPGAVAPLGTALTAEQCALLWTMAEEPILCFDGDKAGQKAQHRALDLALPLIGPGKSLRFALLPEGQDPDDLARAGGPEAVAKVIEGARPLSQVLFERETAQPLDTPERRAALERRLRELTGAIGDESLRRHYRADMAARIEALFGGGRQGPARRERSARPGRRFGNFDVGPRIGIAGAPLAAPAALALRARHAPREIIILAIALSHPALLEAHYEAYSALDFASLELNEFKGKLLGLPVSAFASRAALADALANAGGEAKKEQILSAAAAMPIWWCIRAEANIADTELVLSQSLALQQRRGALHTELKWAQKALADDPTEQKLQQLLDIKRNMAELTIAEAAVEGFGELSGRKAAAL